MCLTAVWYYIALGFAATALVGACWRYALWVRMVDLPNARSSHQIPTPRGGGMGFVGVWLIATAYAVATKQSFAQAPVLLLSAATIAALGWWDDHQSLSAKVRFLTQMLVASLAIGVIFLHAPIHPWLGYASFPFLVFSAIWSTNLFNFMDGTDGIAAIEAISVLSGAAYLLHLHGADPLAQAAIALAVCVGGFLVWNWPRAKIFMGDGGSSFLGFGLALFALIGELYYGFSVLYWFVLYGVFWFDATVTLLRRMMHGEAWTQPHRSHAYQRLHQMGYSHLRILLGTWLLNGLLFIAALDIFYRPADCIAVLLGVLMLLTGVYSLIQQRFSKIQGSLR